MLNSIDLLVPTRKRPHHLAELLESIRKTAERPERIAVYFYVDEDDKVTVPYLAQPHKKQPLLRWVQRPRVILSRCWDSLWHISTGDIIMHAGDDIVFTARGWDTALTQAFNEEDDPFWLVHGPDGIQNEKLATHSFTSREASNAVGYFVPPYFPALYNDTWLTEVYSRLDRVKYVPAVAIEHMHFSKYPERWDETYAEPRKPQNDQRRKAGIIWQVTEDERIAWAQKFAERINAAKREARVA
jgi:hypothetical protein